MKRILIFSGTTEGRQLADILDASGICADVCVATGYGHEVMTEGQYRNIYTGRLTEEEMKEFMQKGDYAAIVDATHPYAVVVSSNIRQASAQAGLPYYRLRRTLQSAGDDSDVIYVKSQQECVRALEQTSGNILLTTGSKELHCYCENETLRERLFVRVLPGTESIEICHKNGILGRQIIAMQGPFSEEMNLALLHQYQIRYMVTKESGASGGFSEKISAAKKAGVSVFVIENPEAENGEQKENLEEILQEIERLTGKHIRRKQMQVSLVGIGMGNTKLITEEAAERIKGADLLFGAKRLLDAVPAQWNVAAERLPYYLAKDILPCLDDAGEKSGKAIFHAVILFSGDTGFYSGAEKMMRRPLPQSPGRPGAAGCGSPAFLPVSPASGPRRTVPAQPPERPAMLLQHEKPSCFFVLVSSTGLLLLALVRNALGFQSTSFIYYASHFRNCQ